ncbi:MAG: zf-HC2 domain-containing protein [Phycisphaerae bacterium]|nr:zf-HC2 domain-containing protein [Phycisphaerae bacterium]
MECPGKEIIQDYIDGELSSEQAESIQSHIQSCQNCKTELNEILTFHNVINTVVSEDKCPPLDTLKDYINNGCKDDNLTKHIEFCDRCSSYAWAFQASPEELEAWQKQQESAYQEYKSKELGYDTAKETLTKLLPPRIDLLEKTWQSVLRFVLDLKTKTIETWPSFKQGPQLVGALGFDEESDPETDAASIILSTTLYISQMVYDGEIELNQQSIETAIQEVSIKLGAGKQLQKRLIETVPPLIMKSQRD